MKRLAIIAQGLSNGGAERVASILANHFSEDGYPVLFIAAYSPDKEYALNDAVKYVYIETKAQNKLSRMFDRSRKIDAEIQKFKCDEAISFIINETIISNITHSVPITYSLRNAPDHVKENKLNWLICNFIYRRAKKIIFQTKGARDHFPAKIREKGVVIGNPLTENLPCWNAENHRHTIMTACRLTKQKNLKMLICAFSEFHKSHPDFTLQIYGRGPLKEELQDYSRQLDVAGTVEFPGYTQDIHQIMSESAIFVLSSDFEGLSNSMLEALAIGLPAICTDCPPGGAAEYIKDGVNGMLIPVGETKELERKLCYLAENPDMCKTLSVNSQKIRESLNEDAILEKWKKHCLR